MDVVSLPVEYDEKEIDGRYRLVIAVSKRAKELYHGARPKIASKAVKMTTVALEEVVSGSVSVLTGEAAVKAKKEAGKLTYEDMMDEAQQKASLPEDMTELEKDLRVYLREKEEVSNENTAEEIFPEKGSK